MVPNLKTSFRVTTQFFFFFAVACIFLNQNFTGKSSIGAAFR